MRGSHAAAQAVLAGLFSVVLAACGGGGGGSSTSPLSSPASAQPAPATSEPAAAPAPAPVAARECLPSPYFPVCNGSARKYKTTQIESATVGQLGVVQNIVLGPPVAQGSTIEYQTAVDTCSSYPGVSFFEEQWAFGAGVPSMAATYADSVWSTPDGRQFIGEGHGHTAGAPDQVLSSGEPILTLAPVAGETIQTTYTQSLTGCGGTLVPFTPTSFNTTYYTVEHLDSFTDGDGVVWHDVWHTALEEWDTQPNGQRYYDYYFARSSGLVQMDCWTANPDHYSCGRQDTLIKEAL